MFSFVKQCLKFQKEPKKSKAARNKSPEPLPFDPTKCFYCRQKLEENPNLKFFETAPEGAKDEFEAVFDPSLKADMFGATGGESEQISLNTVLALFKPHS